MCAGGRAPLVSLLAVVATACGSGESGTTAKNAVETKRFAQPAPSPREDVPSALEDPDDERLPAPLVDTDEIIAGGPPPDGIPPIDEPTFQPADAVDWLKDNEHRGRTVSPSGQSPFAAGQTGKERQHCP